MDSQQPVMLLAQMPPMLKKNTINKKMTACMKPHLYFMFTKAHLRSLVNTTSLKLTVNVYVSLAAEFLCLKKKTQIVIC